MSYYQFHAKQEIEQHLDDISESILLESANDTEKVQQIIRWERDLFFSSPDSFDKRYELLLRKTKNPIWYIHLRKASCGELAIVFEDMANRTNLTYRKIVIDGFINPKDNSTENHRWSEVWLENDWRITDSGFNFFYPNTNNLIFTDGRDFLIGHVAVLNEDKTYIDCTSDYVNRSEKLIIKAVKNGEIVENASVIINLNYNDTSCRVVGGKGIKYFTNDSGLCEVTLGVYDNVSYTVVVEDIKSVYKYSGQDEITINNNKTSYLDIELNKKKLRYNILFIYFMYFIMLPILLIELVFIYRMTKKYVSKRMQ